MAILGLRQLAKLQRRYKKRVNASWKRQKRNQMMFNVEVYRTSKILKKSFREAREVVLDYYDAARKLAWRDVKVVEVEVGWKTRLMEKMIKDERHFHIYVKNLLEHKRLLKAKALQIGIRSVAYKRMFDILQQETGRLINVAAVMRSNLAASIQTTALQASASNLVANNISFKIDEQFQQTLNAYANFTSKSFVETLLHQQSQLARHATRLLKNDIGVVRAARKKADARVKFLSAKSTAIPSLRVADVVVLQKAAGDTEKWKRIAHITDYRGPEQIRVRLKGKKRKVGGKMVPYDLKDKGDQIIQIAGQTRSFSNRIRWSIAGSNARSCDLMNRKFAARFRYATAGKAYKNSKKKWSTVLSKNDYYRAGYGKKLTLAQADVSGSRWSPEIRRRLYGDSANQVIPSIYRRAMRHMVSDMTRHMRGQETLWKMRKRHRERFLV